jgi:hypothetical protein
VRPGDLLEDGALREVLAPNPQRKQTIREFIKAGEDFADALGDRTLTHLIASERQGNCDFSDVASMWLLNDILPAVNPAILDRRCWKQCLQSLVYSSPGHYLLL